MYGKKQPKYDANYNYFQQLNNIYFLRNHQYMEWVKNATNRLPKTLAGPSP